jgi:hypothetical protein
MVGLLSLWTALLLAAGTWLFVGWVRPRRAVPTPPSVFHLVWRLRDPGTGEQGLPFRLEVRRDGPVTEAVRLRAPGPESRVTFEDLVIERGGGRAPVPASGWSGDPLEPGGPIPPIREWTLPLGADGRLVVEGRVRLRPPEGDAAAGFLGPEASVFTGRQVFLLPVVAPRDTVRARVEGQAHPGHVFVAPGLSSPRVPYEELLDTPLAFGDFVAIDDGATGLRVHEDHGAAGARRIVEEIARELAPALPGQAFRGMEVIAVAAPAGARHLEGGVARAGVAADVLPDAPHRRARFAERLLTGALLAAPGRLRFGPARDAWLGPGLVGALVQDLRGRPGFEPPVAGETGWGRLERLFGVSAGKLGVGLADLGRAPAVERRALARLQAPLAFRRLEAAVPDLRRAAVRAHGQPQDDGNLRGFVEKTAGAEAAALLDALIAPGGVPWLSRLEPADGPGSSTASPGPGALRVIASGVTRGLLDGCGCAQGDAGGLPRRAAAILAERAERAATLFLDAGDLFPSPDPLRTDALTEEVIVTTLRAMRSLGLDALAIGANEAQPGGAFLRRMVETAGVPMISCNLVDPRQDGPVFPPHAIVERAGVRYGIVGVTAAPADRVREERLEAALRELRIEEPFESVRRAAESLRGSVDRIVVLGAVAPDVVRRIARDLPYVDLVVSSDSILVPPPSGRGGYARDVSGLLGRTLVVYTAPAGHPLEVADVEWDRAGARPAFAVRRRELPASEPEDLATRALVDDFLRRVGEDPRFRPPATPFFAEGEVENLAGNAWRGSAACDSCHPRQTEQWRETPHARAWERLRREEQHYRAACVACHTTGYGERTGFRIGAPDRQDLASVGCEACHGPGGRHIDAQGRGFIRRELPEHGCRACHDAVNDPAFERDYADRRRKVRH